MNGRLDGGPCEWLVGKLQGPENKHGPKWSRKYKSNWKMAVVVVTLEMRANAWEVTSLKPQDVRKRRREEATVECPKCECTQPGMNMYQCVLTCSRDPTSSQTQLRHVLVQTGKIYVNMEEICCCCRWCYHQWAGSSHCSRTHSRKWKLCSLPVNQLLFYLTCEIWLFPWLNLLHAYFWKGLTQRLLWGTRSREFQSCSSQKNLI